MLDVALLGTGGMMPLPHRFLTSMLCRNNGNLLLVDCGEGTQVTLKMLGWGFKKINTICITHFHGDHITGLPGLLLTIGNSGRTEPLTIIGPVGLTEIVKAITIVAQDIPFKLEFIEIEENNNTPIQVDDFVINTIDLDHRMQCLGYTVEIKRMGKFNKNKAMELNLPTEFWGKLQKMEPVEYNGKTYTYDMVLGEERKGIKIAYTTDTRPVENICEFVKDSDLFICEGIYAEDEKIDKAVEYKHMTFTEAATIAKNSNVKELWLTHFSPSLVDPKEFEPIAKNVFENSIVGYDRMYKTFCWNSL